MASRRHKTHHCAKQSAGSIGQDTTLDWRERIPACHSARASARSSRVPTPADEPPDSCRGHSAGFPSRTSNYDSDSTFVAVFTSKHASIAKIENLLNVQVLHQRV